jgi:hypothetical protein
MKIISLILCCVIGVFPSCYIATPTLGYKNYDKPELPTEDSTPAFFDIIVLNMLIGSMKIWSENEMLNIQLTLTMNDWYLDMLQLHITDDLDLIPQLDGIPQPENFEIQIPFSPYTNIEYLYQFPITDEIGTPYFIAMYLTVEQWSSNPEVILEGGKQKTWIGDTIFSMNSPAVYLTYTPTSGTSEMPEGWSVQRIKIHHMKWHKIGKNFEETLPIYAKHKQLIGYIHFVQEDGTLKIKLVLLDNFWISRIDFKSHEDHHQRIHEKLNFNPAISQWEYELDLRPYKNHFHLSDFNLKLTVWGDFVTQPPPKPPHNR